VFAVSWVSGLVVSALVLGVVGWAIVKTKALPETGASIVAAPVKSIGQELMTTYVMPLQVAGLLLTATLIGAVILAMQDKKEDRQ
jgi:NADH-quinone oxidoreductase subunit J